MSESGLALVGELLLLSLSVAVLEEELLCVGVERKTRVVEGTGLGVRFLVFGLEDENNFRMDGSMSGDVFLGLFVAFVLALDEDC